MVPAGDIAQAQTRQGCGIGHLFDSASGVAPKWLVGALSPYRQGIVNLTQRLVSLSLGSLTPLLLMLRNLPLVDGDIVVPREPLVESTG